MNDKEVSKICGICGDRANGYNFNAITCESCKAFFRRNALRNKEFKCPFDGKCKIDSVTRKFCKKCRLKKCLEKGMKKEWILSDEEKQVLKTKIAENRRKRQTNSKDAKTADSTTGGYKFPNMVQLIQNSYNDNYEKSMSTETNSSAQQDIEMTEPTKVYETQSISSTSEPNKTFINLNNHFSGQSSPASNASVIKVQTPQNPYNFTISALNPINPINPINNCTDCYEGQCSIAKPMYPPMQSIPPVNTETTTQSPEQQFTNKCSVITVNSVENIKNSCIDNIGKLYTKPDELEIRNNGNKCDNKEDIIPDNVYQKAIELEFAPIPFKHSFHDTNDFEFNRDEIDRIRELTTAATDLRPKPINYENIKITNEVTDINVAMKMWTNRCDVAIKKLVELSKKIKSFTDLCLNDQIGLMKGGCFEILIMRSVVSYNKDQEYWTIISEQNIATKMRVDIFKERKHNIYEAYKKFLNAFKLEWDNDTTLLDLLTAIILFTPDRQNILHKEIIKLEQQIYMYLLQRYLLSKYKSKCDAKLKFLKLMTKLEELHKLHDEHIKMYLEVNPQDIGPLLIEILDLNPYNSTLYEMPKLF